MIGHGTYCGTYGGLEMVYHPGGTDSQLHQRQHRLAVATEMSKRELEKTESNKKGIAETGDGVTTSAKRKVCAIASE